MNANEEDSSNNWLQFNRRHNLVYDFTCISALGGKYKFVGNASEMEIDTDRPKHQMSGLKLRKHSIMMVSVKFTVFGIAPIPNN